MEETTPEKKQYNLRPVDTQLIKAELMRHSQMLSSILNFIAADRLAWPINELTAYQLNDDLTQVQIWQQDAPSEGGEVTEGEAPEVPVETDTAKAMKRRK